jgi:hypothetical protein
MKRYKKPLSRHFLPSRARMLVAGLDTVAISLVLRPIEETRNDSCFLSRVLCRRERWETHAEKAVQKRGRPDFPVMHIEVGALI